MIRIKPPVSDWDAEEFQRGRMIARWIKYEPGALLYRLHGLKADEIGVYMVLFHLMLQRGGGEIRKDSHWLLGGRKSRIPVSRKRFEALVTLFVSLGLVVDRGDFYSLPPHLDFAFGNHRELPENWAELRLEVFRRDNFTCRYCGRYGGLLDCDHIVPLIRGGDSSLENLATACAPCNRSKGSKRLEEWMHSY